MKEFVLALLFAALAPAAFAQSGNMLGVFNIEILKEGEVLATPMVAVYLDKPDEPASVAIGSEDGRLLEVVLDILDVTESGARVQVEYGYGDAGDSGEARFQEEVALSWKEQETLVFQRDPEAPQFELLVTLSREDAEAFKERMPAGSREPSE